MVHEWSNGFPSGHAQGSVTLWGYLAYRIQNAGFRTLCTFLVGMIVLSRLYLGAHYLADVLGGLAIGLAVLALFLMGFARNWGAGLPTWAKLALSIVVPLGMMLFYGDGHAPLVLGALMGMLTTNVFVLDGMAYEERVSGVRQAGKLAVGFAGFAVLYAPIRLWVPEGMPELLGFVLIGGWVTTGAPLVFRALGLAPLTPLTREMTRVLRRFAIAAVVLALAVLGLSLAA